VIFYPGVHVSNQALMSGKNQYQSVLWSRSRIFCPFSNGAGAEKFISSIENGTDWTYFTSTGSRSHLIGTGGEEPVFLPLAAGKSIGSATLVPASKTLSDMRSKYET